MSVQSPNTQQITQSTNDTRNNFDPSNPDDETENANSNMNDQMPNNFKIVDISFTQIVEVSNNHQRSDHLPADSNLQSGLAPNDLDHVASSSRADNVEIIHIDTNGTGTMNDTAKEAPTQPVDVITRKLKKKNNKIVTTNIVKIKEMQAKDMFQTQKRKPFIQLKRLSNLLEVHVG